MVAVPDVGCGLRCLEGSKIQPSQPTARAKTWPRPSLSRRSSRDVLHLTLYCKKSRPALDIIFQGYPSHGSHGCDIWFWASFVKKLLPRQQIKMGVPAPVEKHIAMLLRGSRTKAAAPWQWNTLSFPKPMQSDKMWSSGPASFPLVTSGFRSASKLSSSLSSSLSSCHLAAHHNRLRTRSSPTRSS